MIITSPEYYGLNPRTQLEDLGELHIGIRKVIKSRIIRKDAEKIVNMAKQINRIDQNLKVSLICSRNICSKSQKLVCDEGIDIIYEDKYE